MPDLRAVDAASAAGRVRTESVVTAATASVDELFAFSQLLGASYSGVWADASTFEVTVLTPLVNMSYGSTPAVGRTHANFSGVAPLFNAAGKLAAGPPSVTQLRRGERRGRKEERDERGQRRRERGDREGERERERAQRRNNRDER